MTSIYDRLGTLGVAARVRILRLLEVEPLQVGELATVVQMPQSTASRHLKALFDEGWLDRRREGTATWFAIAADLPEEAAALWELVKSATDGDHAEDGLRLASVLAARDLDSRAFFGRVGGGWTELRRELYGEAFVLPGLLALLPSDAVVADLGCGPGEVVATLAPWVGKVIGIDREPAMLDAARAHLGDRADVELRQGVLEDPPLADAEVDVALAMLVLHHVEDVEAVARAIAPKLRPGGRLVVVDMVDHDRDEYRRTMGHRHLGFDEGELRAFAAAGGLALRRHVVLPLVPEATGPALFVAVFTAPTRGA